MADYPVTTTPEEELKQLDQALQQLPQAPHPELATDSLLNIFERFPDKDGHGLFWSILHVLEELPNYQERLIESVRRKPTEFSLNMVNRILNSGQSQVNDVDLLELLEEIAGDERWSGSMRENTRESIRRQRGRA